MKATILSLLFIAAFAMQNIQHTKGSDILNRLKDDDSGVTVVLFTFGDAIKSNEELTKTNDEYEGDLFDVLQSYSKFNYARVDASNEDYEDLIEAAEIDINQLTKSPSVLLAAKKEGVWVHGGETLDKIAEYAPVY